MDNAQKISVDEAIARAKASPSKTWRMLVTYGEQIPALIADIEREYGAVECTEEGALTSRVAKVGESTLQFEAGTQPND